MSGENPAKEAARRLLAMPVPDNVREAVSVVYGVNLGPNATYETLLMVRLRQLAKVDLQAAALARKFEVIDND